MMNDVMMVNVLVCGLVLRLVLRKIFPADAFCSCGIGEDETCAWDANDKQRTESECINFVFASSYTYIVKLPLLWMTF